jgi:4-hydroxy-tetrahydrodipicolinate synthase
MTTSEHQSVDRFEGVFSLLLTPFHTDGAIDWGAYEHYVDWQLSHSPQGLFAVCGSSEMKWLTLEERVALARQAVVRAQDTPVVATANLALDRSTHLDEVRRMVDTGVAGVVLVPPDGLGHHPDRLYEHLAILADAAGCPVFLYEWPQVSPYLIAPDLFAALVEHHGVVAIKDTTCTREGIRAKIEAAPTAIVYQANTPYLPEAVAMGARGIMAITSAAAGDRVVRYWRATMQDNNEDADLHRQLVFLDAVLRFGYPATAKYLAQQQGIPMEIHCRWPAPLAAEAYRAVDVWLQTIEQVSISV